jgi:hypothetical protein
VKINDAEKAISARLTDKNLTDLEERVALTHEANAAKKEEDIRMNASHRLCKFKENYVETQNCKARRGAKGH